MACPILCSSCGGGLNEVYDFINLAKQWYYKSLGDKIPENISADKLKIIPNLALPIGFILDAAGLKLICCRMHILGVIKFDKN